VARSPIERNPFHPLSSFDTATLCGVAYGQTVLARAEKATGLSWDEDSAHSAALDAAIRTYVFCDIVNRFQSLFTSIAPQDWSAEESNL
jgi:ribonuclease T